MNAHVQDRSLDTLARRQHGAFHRRQVLELGFTVRQIEHRRNVGHWVTLAPSVYALASHPYTWLRQVKAAELSIPGSAVSHRSGAVLLGFDDYRPGAIDLLAPRSGAHRSKLATVHRTEKVEAIRRQLVRVTTVPRTVADLAGAVDPWRLGRTVDGVLLSRAATVDDLAAEAALAASDRRAGAGTLRRILEDRGDGYVPPTSELEALLYLALEDPRLPPSIRQAAFPWRRTGNQRVDALIPMWRLIVEADGRRWHTRLADFERDLARDHLAKRHGFEVLRLTHRQLTGSIASVVELLLEVGVHRVPLAA
jgi:very-short-patch-repair endonuclease